MTAKKYRMGDRNTARISFFTGYSQVSRCRISPDLSGLSYVLVNHLEKYK